MVSMSGRLHTKLTIAIFYQFLSYFVFDFNVLNYFIVTVTWQIQFHLLISRGSWGDTHAVQQSIGPGGCVSEVWLGPLQQHIDTIDWCLPITVLPSLYSELPPPQQTLSL